MGDASDWRPDCKNRTVAVRWALFFQKSSQIVTDCFIGEYLRKIPCAEGGTWDFCDADETMTKMAINFDDFQSIMWRNGCFSWKQQEQLAERIYKLTFAPYKCIIVNIKVNRDKRILMGATDAIIKTAKEIVVHLLLQ